MTAREARFQDRKRVLLLDDSPLVLEVVRRSLEAAGIEVLTAASLEEFERHCGAARRLDLVLLDLQLPEVFGDDLGAALKLERGFRCPIHLVSSLERHELERRAGDAGLDGFICKSDGMEALVRRVREILAEQATTHLS
jgi:DNA-binding response OmpR family regulator